MATYINSISKKDCGIYYIKNLKNNKVYIGASTDIRQRINGHLYDLRKGIHGNSYLQEDWDKYCFHDFKFEIIEICKKEDLNIIEHFHVCKMNALSKEYGYNIKPTSDNNKFPLAEETKIKMSNSNKGRKATIEVINKIKIYSNSEIGKLNFLKAREKLKYVDYNIVNMPKRKKVIDITTGEIYDSLILAAKAIGIPKERLSKYLTGKRNNKTNLKYT